MKSLAIAASFIAASMLGFMWTGMLGLFVGMGIWALSYGLMSEYLRHHRHRHECPVCRRNREQQRLREWRRSIRREA